MCIRDSRISTELEHFYANYGFIVTSTELQEVEQAKSQSINFSKLGYLKDDSECEEDEPVEEVFERNHTYLLIPVSYTHLFKSILKVSSLWLIIFLRSGMIPLQNV